MTNNDNMSAEELLHALLELDSGEGWVIDWENLEDDKPKLYHRLKLERIKMKESVDD